MKSNVIGESLFKGPVFDKVGRQIVPGSIITYGHASGGASLRIGKVIKIIYQIIPVYNNYRRDYKITIQGINDDFVNYNEPNYHRPTLLTKKSILQFPSRIMVLDEKNLPEEFRELLSTVEVEEL